MRSVLGWVVLAPLIKRIEFIKSPKLLTLVTASESPTNLEGLIVWKKRAGLTPYRRCIFLPFHPRKLR